MFIFLSLLVFHIVHSAAVNPFPRSSSQNDACDCSYGTIPVPVDVNILVDPSQPINSSGVFRRLQAVYDVFGVLCGPRNPQNSAGDVQMLLHGSTYTTQYWTFPINGFQNYSYVAHACAQGKTTFAYDNIGAGLTSRPANASDVQIPVAAAVASFLARKLKDGTVAFTLTGERQSFRKVAAIGHSLGSSTFNYAVIIEGASSPFDALILTGSIHEPQFLTNSSILRVPARDADPARWGSLDPDYITSGNRIGYYPPDPNFFSPDVFSLDELTKDVSSRWLSGQISDIYQPAKGYRGPVVEMVGSMDQAHCLDQGHPCVAASLQQTERPYFPDSRNFTAIVRPNSGHDINFDFGAADTFKLYLDLVDNMLM